MSQLGCSDGLVGTLPAGECLEALSNDRLTNLRDAICAGAPAQIASLKLVRRSLDRASRHSPAGRVPTRPSLQPSWDIPFSWWATLAMTPSEPSYVKV